MKYDIGIGTIGVKYEDSYLITLPEGIERVGSRFYFQNPLGITPSKRYTTPSNVRNMEKVLFTQEINAKGLLFGVADGVTMTERPSLASQTFCELLLEEYKTAEMMTEYIWIAMVNVAKEKLHSAMKERNNGNECNSRTTFSGGVLLDDMLYTANVGDSATVLIRRGSRHNLTITGKILDAVRQGYIVPLHFQRKSWTEALARTRSYKGMDRALQACMRDNPTYTENIGGSGDIYRLDFNAIKLEKGDMVLSATDGALGIDGLDDIITGTQGSAQKKIDAAFREIIRTCHRHDDATAILICAG